MREEDHPGAAKEAEAAAKTYSMTLNNSVRTGVFWAKWVTVLSISLLMGFLGSYQKTYGQIYVKDDNFLSLAATIQNFINGTGRILWGFFFDYLGYRV